MPSGGSCASFMPRLFTPRKKKEMETTTLNISGMTCGHCVASVTEELKALDGVSEVSVDLNAGGVSTATVTSKAIIAAVKNALDPVANPYVVEDVFPAHKTAIRPTMEIGDMASSLIRNAAMMFYVMDEEGNVVDYVSDDQIQSAYYYQNGIAYIGITSSSGRASASPSASSAYPSTMRPTVL